MLSDVTTNPTLRRAIVRLPGANFADGLTNAAPGAPDFARALDQHAAYRDALVRCGLELTILPADPAHPDGTFVEDAAVLAAGAAMITRPGAPSRRGEIDAIRAALADLGVAMSAIDPPGTLDGGDVCDTGEHVFIGISERTNAHGAAQLAEWFAAFGRQVWQVDIRALGSILHLKSGVAELGDGCLLLIDELAAQPAFAAFDRIVVDADEAYAANAVRINDHVLLASGHPRLEERLVRAGYRTLALDMSEFAKMDGGLSCLSLRF